MDESNVIDYQPHFRAMNDSMDWLGRKMDELIKISKKAPDYRYELVTIDTTDNFVFDPKGYPYFALWAGQENGGDPTYRLQAKINGLVIPVAVQAGFNPISLPANSIISMGDNHAPVTFLAMWYSEATSSETVSVDGLTRTDLRSSTIQQPVEMQARYSQTVQTHNAVTVAASGNSTATTWIDCDGFADVSVTFVGDASVSNGCYLVWSNDGANTHGGETLIATAARTYGAGSTQVKARYLKVQLVNGDAATHVMSAWAYLRA